MLGLMGEKVGMTQAYDQDGNVQPVTVVRAGPCTVVQVKTVETDGYNAIQMGFGTAKPRQVNKPYRGHCEKQGVGLCTSLREFRTEKASAFKVGQVLTVKAFQPGDIVDVQGVTKGRGFQGVMKRHGKHGGPASHGSTVHRRPGSIGMCAWPGRVFKNMKLPGHMGVDTVTTKNLTIIGVRPDDNLLLIEGAVPGHRGGQVAIFNRAPEFESRDAFKAEQPAEAAEQAEEDTETAEAAAESAAGESEPQPKGQAKE